jgi:hypothetical protein
MADGVETDPIVFPASGRGVKKKQGDWESYSLGTLRSINSEYVFIEI